MFKRIDRSLTSTLTLYVVVGGIIALLSIFFVLGNIGKKILFDIEKEKAELIAKMFAPQIGLNLYLGMEDRLEETLNQIMTQKDIVSVFLKRNGKVIHSVKTEEENASGEIFRVEVPVFAPDGKERMAMLELYYSSLHYQQMSRELTRMLLLFLSLLALMYFGLVYLIRKRLKPLKKLATSLANYDVKHPVVFREKSREREIRQIEKAIEKMQKNIRAYTDLQRNMNQILYEKVEEKTAELWKQLYTDALTDLPNRKALMDDLLQVDTALLAIVNIDDFTEINDLYGNDAGDQVLKQFARKLEKLDFDKVYRTSADEYVVLKKEAFTAGDAMQFIKEVRDSIEMERYFYEDTLIDLRVTIGATIEFPPTIVQADMAYKMAKKARKPLMIFSSEWNMEKNFRENIHWVSEIKRALAEGRIHPYAQPLYDLGKKRIKGYEMLMRLVTEDGTVVPPSFFLSLAQKTHHYPAMTRRIVEESCAFFADKKDVTFSINLSVEDILNEETVAFIKERIEHYHVTNRIVFELLESENIELYPEVETFVEAMKEMGCQIAIDDFGTGYSNFAYLVKLKVDYIKIDGSLIKNIHTDKNIQVVVETIVLFAKKLGVKTVAEFISNEMIYETVERLGVDIIQGYYIDEPKPLEEIEKGGGAK
ncbi:GGDEF domain-containing phosphodiesterase [Hydrogenimonas cancrithermarum]|uniref:Diguanylate cyclase/phosphodiesterase n=1 Tax=Hydrogenimonas cancrithermarum TaxID=2993563 RepID=A0ABM8FIJ1_9BACT|nr:GGDEF domain-containing phosphodiesterase [Hydrogenimonas cancrithermarum]BDY12106.1 hypothetical protein HCR_04180 [Hydrogenimonas cancrithermarum]